MEKSRKIIKNRWILIISVTVFIMIFSVGVFTAKKLLIHERNQSNLISSLQNQIMLLENRIDLLEKNPDEIFSDGGVNYLAIGNSITIHPLANYWWSECGMAASSAEKDYYHIVKSWLESKYDTVNSLAYNFSMWEVLYTDRAETIEIIDSYLSSNLDLITIQLGENVTNLDTFKGDFEYLLNHIKSMVPSAHIIVLGDIITDSGERDIIKKKVCEEYNIDYISFDDIKDNKEYQCGKGITVYDDKGNPHIVEHDGVASHPNDKAMQLIADRVIEFVQD